jgi:hypothetical protein
MKYTVLTVLVCMDVAVFSALYLRATEIVTHAILEGLSEIFVAPECSVPRDLTKTSRDTGVLKFTVRWLSESGLWWQRSRNSSRSR